MVKLDSLDRKIMSALDSDARQPATQLAKKLGVAKETVAFRIHRLLHDGVVKGFYPLIDTSLLNMFFVKIFIKFAEMHPDRQKMILDFLAAYPRMSQVLLLEGKYDVQLFLLVGENGDVIAFMKKLHAFCGKEIREKQVLIVDAMYRFNLKFLAEAQEDIVTVVKGKKTAYALDDISLSILGQLTKDARIPLLTVAKNLGISAQLAQYHLKKLIRDKVIVSTHVALNYNSLDVQHYHLTFQVNDHSVLPGMIQFFQTQKKSIFATTMIGCYDGSAEVIVQNAEELRIFVSEFRRLFADALNMLDVFLIYKEYELNLYPL